MNDVTYKADDELLRAAAVLDAEADKFLSTPITIGMDQREVDRLKECAAERRANAEALRQARGILNWMHGFGMIAATEVLKCNK